MTGLGAWLLFASMLILIVAVVVSVVLRMVFGPPDGSCGRCGHDEPEHFTIPALPGKTPEFSGCTHVDEVDDIVQVICDCRGWS